MADLKISEMTPAAELTGAELIECVQGGVNVKQELTGLKTWVNDGVQPFSSTLDALSSFNTNGIMVQTDTSEFIGRTIEGTTSQIVVSNGNGVAGNPTISLPASGVTEGIYGSASLVPIVTVNSKGIVTGVSTASLTVSPVFSDSEFRIYDNGDANKILAFEVSSIVVSPAATPTTKTITMPNANVNLGDLPSVATNDANSIALAALRCRILGGSGNTVSGTDNIVIGGNGNVATGTRSIFINCSGAGAASNDVIALNASGINASSLEANCILLGTSKETDIFKSAGTAAALRLNALYALSSAIPISGTLYATIDGSQTLSASNLVLGVNDTAACAAHEVEFIVCVGAASGFGGVVPTGYFIAKRRIAVFRHAPSGTFYVSAVQTVGTDVTLGTLGGTITPDLSIDTTTGSATIHRLLCKIDRTGGVAGQEVVAMSVRVTSHHSR